MSSLKITDVMPLLDLVSHGILLIDGGLKITAFNASMQNFIAEKLELGDDMLTVIPLEARAQTTLRDALKKDLPVAISTMIPYGSEELIPTELTVDRLDSQTYFVQLELAAAPPLTTETLHRLGQHLENLANGLERPVANFQTQLGGLSGLCASNSEVPSDDIKKQNNQLNETLGHLTDAINNVKTYSKKMLRLEKELLD